MTNTARFFLLPLALLLVSATARADTGGAVAPAREGYGLQILAADAVSLGMVVAGDLMEGEGGWDNAGSDVMFTAGIAGYFAGGPVLHLIHGEPWRAAGSLGMRVALPILGGFVGGQFADCEPDYLLCGLSETGMGVFMGGVVAAVVDAAVLARRSGASKVPTPEPGLALTPRLMATRNLAFVGVGGQF